MSAALKNSGRNEARRKAMLAKVHIGRKRLCLDDETYRAVIAQVCSGKRSAADLDEAELGKLLDYFKSVGFVEGISFTSKLADFDDAEPQHRLIRALWADLVKFKIIRNGSEKSLQAFIKRVAKIDNIRWLGPRESNAVIEGLKAMRARGTQAGKYRTVNVGAATKRTRAMRDVREDLRQLAVNEMVPIGAVAREIGVPSAMLDDWLAERTRIDSARFGRIVEFIDDRAFIWRVMPEASNAIRQEYATKLLANLAILASEMEHCVEEERAGLHDSMTMYLADLRRVVDLMAADAAKLPERLAAALRSALGPGDKMLISRAGNKAGAK
jgi:Protein of unknown function (DUF1018)